MKDLIPENCYLVGGAVRDKLLGLIVKDHDWVVVGLTHKEMIKNKFIPVGKDFPVYLHPITKEEYALARTEKKSGVGYKGFEFNSLPTVTLKEDLSRRDLTINAMAIAHNGNLIDPFGGQKDLENRYLRHTSNAFIEDPLRVLRVARFHAQLYHLDFHIAPETLTLLKKMTQSGELKALTPERVWIETTKALSTQHPHIYVETLESIGAFKDIFPDLYAPKYFKHAQECLAYASKQIDDIQIRFSCFAYYLLYQKDINHSIEQINLFSKRLPIPKHIHKYLRLLRQHESSILNSLNASPELLLTLIQKLNGLGNTSLFDQLLLIASVIFKDKQNIVKITQRLKEIRSALVEVDNNELVHSQMTNSEKKEIVERNYINVIKQC